MSINVRGWRDHRGRASHKLIQGVIRDHIPDVVAFQEVRFYDNLISDFEEIGYNFYFYNLFDDYGLAFASKNQAVISKETLTSSTEPRGLLISNVEGINVVNTHFSPRRKERIIQHRETQDIIEQLPSPKIVLGDFNFPRKQKLFNSLLEVKTPGTYPSVFPVFRLDRVYYCSSGNLASSEVIRQLVSDHLPIKVTLEI